MRITVNSGTSRTEKVLEASRMVSAGIGDIQYEKALEALEMLKAEDDPGLAVLVRQLEEMLEQKSREPEEDFMAPVDELEPQEYELVTQSSVSGKKFAQMNAQQQVPAQQMGQPMQPAQDVSPQVQALVQQIAQLRPEEKQQLMQLL